MRIDYKEYNLKDIIDYFKDGFEPNDGEEFQEIEMVALDQVKGKVVFKALIKDK